VIKGASEKRYSIGGENRGGGDEISHKKIREGLGQVQVGPLEKQSTRKKKGEKKSKEGSPAQRLRERKLNRVTLKMQRSVENRGSISILVRETLEANAPNKRKKQNGGTEPKKNSTACRHDTGQK